MVTTHAKTLRHALCEQRRSLNSDKREKLASKVYTHLTTSPFYTSSEKIGAYFSTEDEVGTNPIINKIHEDKKICYLPVLNHNRHGYMDFIRFNRGDRLIENRFNIFEPIRSNQETEVNKVDERVIDAKALDLVLVPLVAVDKQGNRLGMGAGYYDRSFSFLLNQPRAAKPILIGLAYDFQRVTELEPDRWDIPLNGVVTESGLFEFSRR